MVAGHGTPVDSVAVLISKSVIIIFIICGRAEGLIDLKDNERAGFSQVQRYGN